MSDFLYALITDRRLYRQSLVEAAREAEAARIHYFQLREKDLSSVEFLSLAKEIRSVLRRTRLIVNGRLDVAISSGADGVHLQSNNIPVAAVRAKFPELLIGYSAHSPEELAEAERGGADYAFLSPVFQPVSKNVRSSPLGLAKFSEWISGIGMPVFALGGVTAETLPELRASGCAGAAGISLFVKDGIFNRKGW
jgi:thiamine-phosphate pyrophosphorylase